MSDEQNYIGRTGFHYRPKARASKIGFMMGFLDIKDPRDVLNHCIDEMYRAYMIACDKARETEKQNEFTGIDELGTSNK